ncbi:MAG: DUF2207 domain-containing protein [Nocardioides sp.]
MKRVVASVVGLVVVVLVLLAPALFYNSGAANEETSDPTTITSYVAVFDLADNGDLDVVETLTVDFPIGVARRGIFRFFDRVDPSATDTRRLVEDIEVTMDGEEVETDESVQDGRFDVVRVGSENVIVAPGRHVYEISYHIDGVITPGTDGSESQFYWNLIPSGWAQDIEQASLTVNLPAPAVGTICGIGLGDLDELQDCQVSGDGQALVITTGPLEPQTPVTLKTGLEIETPDAGTTLPWGPRFDNVFGRSPVVLGVVVLLALGAAFLGAMFARRSYEANPQFPLMYAPPDGIGPAQATYILTEEIGDEAFVATLMHAAEKGAVDLQKSDDAWTITDKGGPEGWAGLDPVTIKVAHLLGGPGTSFVAKKKDVQAGERLKTEIASFKSSTEDWATSSGNLTSAGLGGLGSLLVLAGFAGVLAALFWNPFHLSMVGLIPGGFAILGAPLLKTGAGTKRTRQGRELWSRVGGFHRVLSTPSSQGRFDFSGREDLYTKYIPWALALGCADEWAAKYRTEMGHEPPAPHYLAGGYAGAATGSYVNSMVSDFNSTVDSAISSYQATQSSSSSGGGGFSGGGGGGGGGGGSW